MVRRAQRGRNRFRRVVRQPAAPAKLEPQRKPPAVEEGSVSNPNWIAAPPAAPLAPPPLPPVIKTSADNRFDRRIITIAALVLGAVLLIAGVGYKLLAKSDEGTSETQNPEAVVAPAEPAK